MNSFLAGIFICLSMYMAQQKAIEVKYQEDKVTFLREYLSVKYPTDQFSDFIYVAVKKQRLYYVSKNRIIREYVISSAERGIGSSSGSYKTPVGLHRISEMVGEGVPLNGIIKHKIYTGEIAEIETRPLSTDLDIITTRAIHLSGEEEGVNLGNNKDSYNRGIFIHGTNEEGLLGRPASRGCIRMANKDIVGLFAVAHEDMPVIILNN